MFSPLSDVLANTTLAHCDAVGGGHPLHQFSVTFNNADPTYEYLRFLEGENRAPPEDVGGTLGFADFLEATGKSRHPQHRELVRW